MDTPTSTFSYDTKSNSREKLSLESNSESLTLTKQQANKFLVSIQKTNLRLIQLNDKLRLTTEKLTEAEEKQNQASSQITTPLRGWFC